MVSEEAWRKLGQPTLSAPGRTLRGPDTHRLPTTGQFTAKLSKEGHTAEEEIYVVKKVAPSPTRTSSYRQAGTLFPNLVGRPSKPDSCSPVPGTLRRSRSRIMNRSNFAFLLLYLCNLHNDREEDKLKRSGFML